jgi:hypothetical protein
MNLDLAAICFTLVAMIVFLVISTAYLGVKILLWYLAFVCAVLGIIKYDRWKNGT